MIVTMWRTLRWPPAMRWCSPALQTTFASFLPKRYCGPGVRRIKRLVSSGHLKIHVDVDDINDMHCFVQ